MKYCGKCKKEKSSPEFCRDKRAKDGLYSICRLCHYKFYGGRHPKQSEYQRKYMVKSGYMARYRKENRAKMNESVKRWYKNKGRFSIRVRLNRTMATSMGVCLKGGKAHRSWSTLVNYTMEEFKEHLESLFDEHMNWDNYGSYWHVDHIIPKSHFNFITAEDEEFQKCWVLENLQPLEAKANRVKYNKIISV